MVRFSRFAFALASIPVLMIGPLQAKTHRKTAQPQDQIEVVAHLPLNGNEVTRFLVTQHSRRNYLYAESSSGNTVTLVDVTEPNKPSVLADVGGSFTGGKIVTVAGTAALISSTSAGPGSTHPQTFRFMSFADPAHPIVSREFSNVSAIGRDDVRGLIFLANGQGLWILHEKLATDPDFEKEWEHTMLDNR